MKPQKTTASKKTVNKNLNKNTSTPLNNEQTLLFGDLDLYLFHEGRHVSAYKFMGAHIVKEGGIIGIRFTTWAPNATKICVIGDFSDWQENEANNMHKISSGGLWSVFIPKIGEGCKYKFAVYNHNIHSMVYKSDPYATAAELRPHTASIVTGKNYHRWGDSKWLKQREETDPLKSPMNIYELHLASWKTKDGEFLSYDELSEILPTYIKDMGYTHIELMPLHEHPLDKSWGYQATGYYAVTSRHGNLVGLKKLIDQLHRAGIGVILDWVAGHFGQDEHGLINFDGTPCYEYQAYWRAHNKGWGAHNFDLGRNEVKTFLISNALYWLNEFHIDGLRVDAVSNILYLSYDREHGEWQPNICGGNENLEGTNFLKQFNYEVHANNPGIVTIAEESTAWPKITTPVEHGGLGFNFKWNMGWMNDTLRYVPLDPIYRKYHHSNINFSMLYHYSEHFILAISHDEVVHGKGALIDKMWGDLWNKYAGLRMYSGYMMGHPGKKLLFMGTEFGQFVEWREHEQLQWQIIDEFHTHKETKNYFRRLNHFYLEHPALWDGDYEHSGFQWIDADNSAQSILSFARYNHNRSEILLFVCNFTPVVYFDYKLGVPREGCYQEIFNSDAHEFGGSGQIMDGKIFSEPSACHSFANSVKIKIPPMATIVLKFCA